MSASDAEKRTTAINEVNVALSDLKDARKNRDAVEAEEQKVLNDLRSKMGTARTELIKVEERYMKARDRLLALTPALPTAEEVPPKGLGIRRAG